MNRSPLLLFDVSTQKRPLSSLGIVDEATAAMGKCLLLRRDFPTLSPVVFPRMCTLVRPHRLFHLKNMWPWIAKVSFSNLAITSRLLALTFDSIFSGRRWPRRKEVCPSASFPGRLFRTTHIRHICQSRGTSYRLSPSYYGDLGERLVVDKRHEIRSMSQFSDSSHSEQNSCRSRTRK